jgi:hypothetical protein
MPKRRGNRGELMRNRFGTNAEPLGTMPPKPLRSQYLCGCTKPSVPLAFRLKIVTDAIQQALANKNPASDKMSNAVQQAIATFREQVATKDDQIRALHQQIDQLHQLLAMKEKVTGELMSERKALNQALEAKRKPWYAKLLPTVGEKEAEPST